MNVPSGWMVEPRSAPFQFAHAGERASFHFTVTIPALENREYRIEAVASSGGRDYREGYDVIQHRDLETRYLYRDAAAGVRGVDVRDPPGLKVGYVMGVGDDVPAGLAQLGVEVQLLSAQELASADLSRFNAIMTGTRAYAVRDDLKTYNRRLLDYAKNGGNLIVLYNTQEFVPNQYAPFPAELPRNAEEVSEEDSPVEILAPADPVFNTPNKITKADFDNWVEQRGSKFWSTWDAAYTPMIATWDRGQAPQKGGWLHAKYGKRPLHVLRVRVPPAAALRRARRVPSARQPAVAESLRDRPPLFRHISLAAAWIIVLLITTSAATAQPCPPLQVRNPAGNYIVPGAKGDIPYSGDLALDAYVQPGAARRPSVVVIHGGGWSSGSRVAHIGQILEAVTRAGYNWFALDYRLGGVGQIDASLADVRAALRFVRCHAAEFGIDPNQLVLLGEDSGADLAARLATERPEGVVGAVLIGGLYDRGAVAPRRTSARSRCRSDRIASRTSVAEPSAGSGRARRS